MDKTLETVTLVHRLVIAVALALFLVGISIEPQNHAYEDAIAEIDLVQNGLQVVSGKVEDAYDTIYDKSELKSLTLAWLREHHVPQPKINIQVINPEDLAVPDSTQDPLITLDKQIKWANQIYRDVDFPFLLCEVNASKYRHSLDEIFHASPKPNFGLSVYIHRVSGTNASQQFACEIEVGYQTQTGTVTGTRRALLRVPTTVIEVGSVDSGRYSDALNVPNMLKGNKLGDYEDSEALVVPNLWALWSDLSGRSPEAAKAFLEQRKESEKQNAKEKIDILGESLDRTVTIIMASIIELCLMIYLLAHLIQIRRTLPQNIEPIGQSPFYGVMCSTFGRFVILATFVIPFGICAFVLVFVFPSLRTEWIGPSWVVARGTRWLLVAFLGVTDALLISQAFSTAVFLNSTTKDIGQSPTLQIGQSNSSKLEPEAKPPATER